MTEYIAKVEDEEIVLKPALLEFGEFESKSVPVYDLNGREIGTATYEIGSNIINCNISKEEYEKLKLTDDGKLPVSIGYKCEGIEDARRQKRVQELEQCRDEIYSSLLKYRCIFGATCGGLIELNCGIGLNEYGNKNNGIDILIDDEFILKKLHHKDKEDNNRNLQ